MIKRSVLLLLCACGLLAKAIAQSIAPVLPVPDPRYKADVLLVVAHPDDDVVIGGYLARISLDEHKRVAVVYCTNGDGGGNAVGWESGAALGKMRMQEARRALASIGIENVWFLEGHDTPGQNVLHSLDHWNHGLELDEVVRLVRITRPDVILTWLPDYVVGENHEDHQAAGVLATESFDAAGDPLQFPEQVSPPRDRFGMSNLSEGLRLWQPKKLYFFTDAFEVFGPYWHDASIGSPFRKNFVEGAGPIYDNKTISQSKHKSYAQLTAEMQAFYLTQEGQIGIDALNSGNLKDWEYPTPLILGKSLVGGSRTGDVFEGVTADPITLHPPKGAGSRESAHRVSLEIGDPWRFYSRFWRAHDLDHLAELIPVPEAEVRFGDWLHIPLLACNTTVESAEISIKAELPNGWTDKTQFQRYPVPAGACYPVTAHAIAPSGEKLEWQELRWNGRVGSQDVGTVTVRVYVGKDGGLPQ
jgi:LmbE family N-acetylglucosaminyl deacetylase